MSARVQLDIRTIVLYDAVIVLHVDSPKPDEPEPKSIVISTEGRNLTVD